MGDVKKIVRILVSIFYVLFRKISENKLAEDAYFCITYVFFILWNLNR